MLLFQQLRIHYLQFFPELFVLQLEHAVFLLQLPMLQFKFG